jgi:YggT family protein
MGMLAQAALLILKSVTGFLSILLLLRFYMQVFRISFSNQIGAFVVHLTNWLVLPMRKAIPSMFGLDMASLLAAYLMQIIMLTGVIALGGGFEMLAQGSMVLPVLGRSVVEVLRSSVYLLIGLLIIQAVLSWVSPYSPLARPIHQMTSPFLRPIQRVVPPIANIDLSPLIAILLAQVVLIFL